MPSRRALLVAMMSDRRAGLHNYGSGDEDVHPSSVSSSSEEEENGGYDGGQQRGVTTGVTSGAPPHLLRLLTSPLPQPPLPQPLRRGMSEPLSVPLRKKKT